MIRAVTAPFVETLQYRSFQAFCDACLRLRCIGLCYGQPGVGKTLSARHYANWDKVSSYKRYLSSCGVGLSEVIESKVVFYTLTISNTPARLAEDLYALGHNLREFLIEDLYRQEQARLEEVKLHEENERQALLSKTDTTYPLFHAVKIRAGEAMQQIHAEFLNKKHETRHPTELVIIDDIDILRLSSLKHLIANYGHRRIGMVLMGMPKSEKRLLQYPQLYSRIGLVHEFQPLSGAEIRQLLKGQWWPTETTLPRCEIVDEDCMAAISRITRGNFRVLYRLLQQIGRIMERTGGKMVTREIIKAARELLVIGTR